MGGDAWKNPFPLGPLVCGVFCESQKEGGEILSVFPGYFAVLFTVCEILFLLTKKKKKFS